MGAKYTLSTAPLLIYNKDVPYTFTVHADSSNATVVKLSTSSDFIHYEELSANQSQEFKDYTGFLYAEAASGSPVVHINFGTPSSPELIKSL